MMSDSEARGWIIGAFELRGLPAPTLAELQGVGAIGRFEGNYGAALGGANNWGAVQCKSRAPCPEGCAEFTDKDAHGIPYQACFRIYESHSHGAADMLREVYRRPGVPEAMRAGNATQVAERMRAGGYFEAPAELYARGIANNAAAIARSMGEEVAIDLKGAAPAAPAIPPAKSTGTAVAELLALVGLVSIIFRLKLQGRK